MSGIQTLEKVINAFIALGFLAVAIGVGLWLLELAGRLNLSLHATLAFAGGIVLAFALLAAKLVSRMES